MIDTSDKTRESRDTANTREADDERDLERLKPPLSITVTPSSSLQDIPTIMTKDELAPTSHSPPNYQSEQ